MEESSDGFWHLKIEARKSTNYHLSDHGLTTMNGGSRIWHSLKPKFQADVAQIHTVTNDSTDRPPLHACRFAAQVFHGLYDEVMSTSARGHGLMLRVQQLEAELPLLEKESCQRDYLYIASNRGGFHTSTSFSFTAHPSLTHSFQKKNKIYFLFTNFTKPPFGTLVSFAGVDWHSNPRVEHGVVTRGDMPRFIMTSIKQCRGPPKLFMLDKYVRWATSLASYGYWRLGL